MNVVRKRERERDREKKKNTVWINTNKQYEMKNCALLCSNLNKRVEFLNEFISFDDKKFTNKHRRK